MIKARATDRYKNAHFFKAEQVSNSPMKPALKAQILLCVCCSFVGISYLRAFTIVTLSFCKHEL